MPKKIVKLSKKIENTLSEIAIEMKLSYTTYLLLKIIVQDILSAVDGYSLLGEKDLVAKSGAKLSTVRQSSATLSARKLLVFDTKSKNKGKVRKMFFSKQLSQRLLDIKTPDYQGRTQGLTISDTCNLHKI